jgi:hypothetical protein
LRIPHENLTCQNLCFLAINTGLNISILITYIVFVTKMQKRQNPEKGSALLKNDITTFGTALGIADT